MGDLDVSMRLRLLYEPGGADKAEADLKALKAAAAGLGSGQGAQRLAQDLGRVEQSADRARGDFDRLRGAADRLRSGGAERLRRDLGRTAQDASRARSQFQGLRSAADRLGSSGGIRRLNRDLSDTERRARRARGELQRLGRTRRGIGSGGVNRGLEEFYMRVGGGRIAPVGLGVGAAAGGLIGGAVLAGGAFVAGGAHQGMSREVAMADVRRAADLTPDQQRRMRRQIGRVSRRDLPLGFDEIAAAVAQAGYAGRPDEDLVRFGTFASKSSIALGITTEQAGEDLAQLANIYELNQEQVELLADTINYLGDTMAAREADIIEFTKRVGGNAKVFGLADNEAAAFGSSLLSLGIRPQVAATAVNALLTKLSAADRQGDKFAAALDEIGLSVDELKQKVADDPLGAILDVLQRIKDLPETEQIGVLSELVGLEHADTIVQIVSKVDDLRGTLEDLSNAEVAGGIERTFEIFAEPTTKQIEQMQQAVAGLADAVSGELSPAIGDAASALTDMINRWTDVLERGQQVSELADKLGAGEALSTADERDLADDPELARRINTERGEQRRTLEERRRQLENQLFRLDLGRPVPFGYAGYSPEKAREFMTRELGDIDRKLGAFSAPPDAELADLTARRDAIQRQITSMSAEARKVVSEAELGPNFDRGEGARNEAARIQKAIDEARRLLDEINAAIGAHEEERRMMADDDAAAGSGPPRGIPLPRPNPRRREVIQDELGVDASDAGEKTGSTYHDALASELDAAAATARSKAQEMIAALSFTVSPTITPHFSAPTGSPAGSTGGSGGGQQTTVHQRIYGKSSPEKTARAVIKAQERAARRTNARALHDTGTAA